MKTPSIFLSSLLVLTPAAARAASCCDTPPAATAEGQPSCCAVTPAATPTAELPDESLYHFDAELIDDNGAPRRLAEFAGRPVVLTMFFASCGYACPMLAHDMRKVQATLPPTVRDQVQFIMVSFDPERDTVEKLQAFRQQAGADERWTLMRGTDGDVRTLAMLLGVQFRKEPSGDISHSNLITVLDAGGAIAHRREGLQGGLPGVSEALVRLATAN